MLKPGAQFHLRFVSSPPHQRTRSRSSSWDCPGPAIAEDKKRLKNDIHKDIAIWHPGAIWIASWLKSKAIVTGPGDVSPPSVCSRLFLGATWGHTASPIHLAVFSPKVIPACVLLT